MVSYIPREIQAIPNYAALIAHETQCSRPRATPLGGGLCMSVSFSPPFCQACGNTGEIEVGALYDKPSGILRPCAECVIN